MGRARLRLNASHQLPLATENERDPDRPECRRVPRRSRPRCWGQAFLIHGHSSASTSAASTAFAARASSRAAWAGFQYPSAMPDLSPGSSGQISVDTRAESFVLVVAVGGDKGCCGPQVCNGDGEGAHDWAPVRTALPWLLRVMRPAARNAVSACPARVPPQPRTRIAMP